MRKNEESENRCEKELNLFCIPHSLKVILYDDHLKLDGHNGVKE